MSGTVHIPATLPIRKLQIPLLDTPFAELAAFLPNTTEFLTDALRDKNAKVLVHCVKGVSRSASVISGYLIAMYGWTTDQAVNYVQSKRMNAQPNRGFISQLDEYARSLKQISPS
jgi:protein-tyrosine phosphatase